MFGNPNGDHDDVTRFGIGEHTVAFSPENPESYIVGLYRNV